MEFTKCALVLMAVSVLNCHGAKVCYYQSQCSSYEKCCRIGKLSTQKICTSSCSGKYCLSSADCGGLRCCGACQYSCSATVGVCKEKCQGEPCDNDYDCGPDEECSSYYYSYSLSRSGKLCRRKDWRDFDYYSYSLTSGWMLAIYICSGLSFLYGIIALVVCIRFAVKNCSRPSQSVINSPGVMGMTNFAISSANQVSMTQQHLVSR